VQLVEDLQRVAVHVLCQLRVHFLACCG
jgi:hypothetical protein